MIATRHLADIADLALSGGTRRRFHDGLFDTLARAVPYDVIYVLAAESENSRQGMDVASRGWETDMVRTTIPIAAREMAESVSPGEYAEPEQYGVEMVDFLESRNLVHHVQYENMIRRPGIERAWLRNWRTGTGCSASSWDAMARDSQGSCAP